MAKQNNNQHPLTRTDFQFVIWIVGISLAVAVPFVTYGNKIEAMELKQQNYEEVIKEISLTIKSIDGKIGSINTNQATIQKDIEFIKNRLDRLEK